MTFYIPLFPFTFAHGYDDINEDADYYTYSLTAYYDAAQDRIYQEDDGTGTRTEINYFDQMQSNPYLMDEFSDNYGAGSSDNIQM
jgi:dTDP-4-dehydrorhamnose 3,5-epimerase-like enzyme